MTDGDLPPGGFVGPFDPARWRVTPMKDGAAAVAPVAGDPAAARFTYAVKLGGGGVPRRVAVFAVVAPATGVVTFDYTLDIYHAWYDVRAEFDVSAGAAVGEQRLQALRFANMNTTGPRTFTGAVAVRVEAGRPFALELAGSNFDSDSRLEGTLTVTRFAAPIPPGWESPPAAETACPQDTDAPPRRRRSRKKD